MDLEDVVLTLTVSLLLGGWPAERPHRGGRVALSVEPWCYRFWEVSRTLECPLLAVEFGHRATAPR